MKYRIIIFIICYIFFLSLTTSGDCIHTKIKINGARRVRGTKEIYFKDSQLENVVRDIIQKPTGPITKLDVKGITELNLENIGISNIKGIENLTNLKKLNISNNDITDITPLKNVVKRGLEEFVITGNPLTIGDLRKLDKWTNDGSYLKLHRQLLDWGFKVVDSKEKNFLYENNIYKVENTGRHITRVWAGEKMVLNDSKKSLEINNIKLEGDNLVLLSGEKEVGIVTPEGLETRESLKKKKIDKNNSEAKFFTDKQDISILQDRTKEEIESINQKIRDFVLESMNAYVIEGISEPEVIKSESGRKRTVKFDVVTDTGNITIYFKPVKHENEGKRTERASEAMLAPESKYISVGRKGYTVMKHFEGTKLVDLLWNKPKTLSNNYKWVFKNLGKKIGTMDKNEMLYKDIIHFNTYVNLDTHEIKIIDYEVAIGEEPVEQIRKLIDNLDKQIDISPEKQEEMLEIFNQSYNKTLDE